MTKRHATHAQWLTAGLLAALVGCAGWQPTQTAYQPAAVAPTAGLAATTPHGRQTSRSWTRPSYLAPPAKPKPKPALAIQPPETLAARPKATVVPASRIAATNTGAGSQTKAASHTAAVPATLAARPVAEHVPTPARSPMVVRAQNGAGLAQDLTFDPSLVQPEPIFPPPGQPYVDIDPTMTTPVDVYVNETQTGRFMFGAGVNSDAGVTGQIVIDERNFDLFRVPHSWDDVINGTAFRGAGQGFRLEAMPGNIVQRYLVSFTEPYLFDTQVSFNTSGFLYDRRFFDWDEERVGGRMSFGYRLTHDLSVNAALRAEQVTLTNPRITTVDELNRAVGKSDLYSGKFTLTHDTRDVPFAPTEGHLIELSYEQVFGDFNYPRGELDYRQYFLLRERPDGSGRHTLGYSYRLGFSGSETPIFENYYAGGYSSLRGFDFRGASPSDQGVRVGGEFLFLGSTEYIFPITADDMVKGALFVDYGTVEEEIELNANNFRVAPGFGLRILIPAMGPAPLALDFAFPVAHADTDDRRVFSFFFGVGR